MMRPEDALFMTTWELRIALVDATEELIELRRWQAQWAPEIDLIRGRRSRMVIPLIPPMSVESKESAA